MEKKYTTGMEIEKLKKEMDEYLKDGSKYTKEQKYIGRKKLGTILFMGLIAFLCVLLISVLSSKAAGKIPSLFGYSIYQVETESMKPTLPVGTRIVSKKPENQAKLKKGDVITFRRNQAVITHRIIEVINEKGTVKYRTKGDNPKNSPDVELVEPEDILGVFQFKLPI